MRYHCFVNHNVLSWSLPLDTEGCSDPQDHSTKWKGYCAWLGLTWRRETWEGVFKLSDLWEQLLGRQVKVYGEITLLGLLCGSWEGQMDSPSLMQELTAPSLPTAVPQRFRVQVSGEVTVISTWRNSQPPFCWYLSLPKHILFGA